MSLERLQAMAEKSNTVLVIWHDKNSSGTLRLTAEEAIELGRVGRMAKTRADMEKEEQS